MPRRRGGRRRAGNIRLALDGLGAERIDHGVAIAEDPELSASRRRCGIPLTVCPSSNVLIANRYGSLADHPFRAMREAGLLVTLNTDDPAMMGWDLGREYRELWPASQGLPYLPTLDRVAVEGIDSTWLDDTDRAAPQARVRGGDREPLTRPYRRYPSCARRNSMVRSNARSASSGRYAACDGSANQCPAPG